jgi:ribonuclease HII
MPRQRTSTAEEEKHWAAGHAHVAGVDEAGRGPLAGPVVVAAVAIDREAPDLDDTLLQDSKALTPRALQRAYEMLTRSPHVHFAVATVTAAEIDQLNILQATFLGMERAIDALHSLLPLGVALIDGPYTPPFSRSPSLACSPSGRNTNAKDEQGPRPEGEKDKSPKLVPIIGGDSTVRVIAAASILAKVTRDRLMIESHALFPQYGFHQHKGYPTAMHREALAVHGPCAIHRLTFAPVRAHYGRPIVQPREEEPADEEAEKKGKKEKKRPRPE